jgi:response regulator RpfG family c-di-GMP phosphodiesterase
MTLAKMDIDMALDLDDLDDLPGTLCTSGSPDAIELPPGLDAFDGPGMPRPQGKQLRPPPTTPLRTILCVDDEANIVRALQRLLRDSGHRILTATSGDEALQLMSTEHVDLLISDLMMPGMTGTALMQRVRMLWPEVTRLLLTGHTDMAAAIAAINEGQVSRYLTKPWDDTELIHTINELFQHKGLEEDKRRLEALTHLQNTELKSLNSNLEGLVQARTEQLEQANERLKRNYFNSIKTFSHLIELRGGQMMGHARRVADLSLRVARVMQRTEAECNDILIAGLLHDIGQIGLPDALINKAYTSLRATDAARFRQHTLMGEQTLISLDDMQTVAAMIRGHHERLDGTGYPDGLRGEDIPVGAQILSVADTYEDLQSGLAVAAQLTPSEARMAMTEARGTAFSPDVLDAFLSLFDGAGPQQEHQGLLVRPEDLKAGMVMAKDFLSPQGFLLLSADHVLSSDLIERIKQFERRCGRPILLTIKMK